MLSPNFKDFSIKLLIFCIYGILSSSSNKSKKNLQCQFLSDFVKDTLDILLVLNKFIYDTLCLKVRDEWWPTGF